MNLLSGNPVKPVALLIHVSDVIRGLEWYQLAFPRAVLVHLGPTDFPALSINGFTLEIVPADEKVSTGRSGTVLYWQVDSVNDELARLETIGATLYRGPIPIESQQIMCQLEDPFGNLLGIRGPA